MSSARVLYRDPERILDLVGLRVGKRVGDQLYVLCPYHEDVTASCSVNLTEQLFKCQGCGKHGNFEELVAQKTTGADDRVSVESVRRLYRQHMTERVSKLVDPGKVEVWHRRLLESHEVVSALKELKGISLETIERHSIGWDGERYTLPIRDREGNWVNVRRRSLDPAHKASKCINLRGFGTPGRLYPVSALASQSVGITEGELKALLLEQMGFPCVTGTSGASNWDPEWNVWFAGKDVWIATDIDEAGTVAGTEIAKQLVKHAKSVRIVHVPLDPSKHPTGGIDDWILLEGATRDSVASLIDGTPIYKFTTSRVPVKLDLTKTKLATLSDVMRPEMHNKLVEVEAIVSGEDPTSFRIPCAWKVACDRDQHCCKDCPVEQQEKEDWGFEPWYHVDLLKALETEEFRRDQELRRITGIPRTCGGCEIRPLSWLNLTIVELTSEVDTAHDEPSTTIQAVLASNTGEAREFLNDVHVIRGFPTSLPKTGQLIMLVHELELATRSLDRYVVEPDHVAKLRAFQPTEWTVPALEAKLEEYYSDLSDNVTHIHGRRDLHEIVDLAYCSLLEIPIAGDHSGWLDVAVLGDGGQGKSDVVRSIRRHYRAGDLAVGGSASLAGILGSAQQSLASKRWVYRRGKLPMNDRRLLIIEESSNLHPDTIRALREPRSSGVHVMTKVADRRSLARTRLVWIGNTRSGRPVADFPQGIMAVLDVFPDEADVRRLDLALIVAQDEVSPDVIMNGKKGAPHKFTPDLCELHTTWTWSRRRADVELSLAAVKAARRLGAELGRRYSHTIPLLLNTEAHLKLLKIGAALAARTFSTDDGHTLVVRECHVEYAVKFIDRIYATKASDFAGYSARMLQSTTMADSEAVESVIRTQLRSRTFAELLLDSPVVTVRLVQNACALDLPKSEGVVGELLRARALRVVPSIAGAYSKTVGFSTLLRRLVADPSLADETAEQRHSGKDY